MKRLTPPTSRPRRGAVLVEFSLTVPILFLFAFASIEFAYVNMLRNTAENAAYEAARLAAIPGGTAQAAQNEALRLMNTVGAQNVSVRVSPSVITELTPEVLVEISMPMNSNGYIASKFLKNRFITRSCTLTRERVHN